MGWMYMHRDKGVTDKEFFSKEFNYSENGNEGRVIETSRKGSIVYIAYQTRRDDSDTYRVSAIVCLTSWNHKEKFNFGYKDIDESMGPVECNCPEKILDLLTPTEQEYAVKWRNKCRDNIKRHKNLPKLSEGMIVDFEEPFSWGGNIGEWKTFLVEKYGKRSWAFRGYQGGRPVTQLLKITNMKFSNYVEVPDVRIVRGRASHYDDYNLFSIMEGGPYGKEVIIRGLKTRESLVRSLKENYTDYANGIQEILMRTLQDTDGIIIIQEMGHFWRIERTTFDGDLTLLLNEVFESMEIPVMSMDINIIESGDNSITFSCEYLYLSDEIANKLADRIENSNDDWGHICNDLYRVIAKK